MITETKVNSYISPIAYWKNTQRWALTQKLKKIKIWLVIKMGRINVDLSDELEKRLRFKTIERFGGRKGDLSRAVEEAIKTWVAL